MIHLIIDLIVWVYTFLVHMLMFKKMVLYEGKSITGNLWNALFWPETEDIIGCKCDPC